MPRDEVLSCVYFSSLSASRTYVKSAAAAAGQAIVCIGRMNRFSIRPDVVLYQRVHHQRLFNNPSFPISAYLCVNYGTRRVSRGSSPRLAHRVSRDLSSLLHVSDVGQLRLKRPSRLARPPRFGEYQHTEAAQRHGEKSVQENLILKEHAQPAQVFNLASENLRHRRLCRVPVKRPRSSGDAPRNHTHSNVEQLAPCARCSCRFPCGIMTRHMRSQQDTYPTRCIVLCSAFVFGVVLRMITSHIFNSLRRTRIAFVAG